MRWRRTTGSKRSRITRRSAIARRCASAFLHSHLSEREQAGVPVTPPNRLLDALAAGNRAYEQVGYIFIVRTGKSADELLRSLTATRRSGNGAPHCRRGAGDHGTEAAPFPMRATLLFQRVGRGCKPPGLWQFLQVRLDVPALAGSAFHCLACIASYTVPCMCVSIRSRCCRPLRSGPCAAPTAPARRAARRGDAPAVSHRHLAASWKLDEARTPATMLRRAVVQAADPRTPPGFLGDKPAAVVPGFVAQRRRTRRARRNSR